MCFTIIDRLLGTFLHLHSTRPFPGLSYNIFPSCSDYGWLAGCTRKCSDLFIKQGQIANMKFQHWDDSLFLRESLAVIMIIHLQRIPSACCKYFLCVLKTKLYLPTRERLYEYCDNPHIYLPIPVDMLYFWVHEFFHRYRSLFQLIGFITHWNPIDSFHRTLRLKRFETGTRQCVFSTRGGFVCTLCFMICYLNTACWCTWPTAVTSTQLWVLAHSESQGWRTCLMIWYV